MKWVGFSTCAFRGPHQPATRVPINLRKMPYQPANPYQPTTNFSKSLSTCDKYLLIIPVLGKRREPGPWCGYLRESQEPLHMDLVNTTDSPARGAPRPSHPGAGSRSSRPAIDDSPTREPAPRAMSACTPVRRRSGTTTWGSCGGEALAGGMRVAGGIARRGHGLSCTDAVPIGVRVS